MKQDNGHITIASDTNVQPHELNTAQAIATSGFDVEFVRRTWGNRVTSADAVINGVVWEMKSPQASDRKALERNLRKASHQSPNVIIDSQRLKGASDAEIEKRYVASVLTFEQFVVCGSSTDAVRSLTSNTNETIMHTHKAHER